MNITVEGVEPKPISLCGVEKPENDAMQYYDKIAHRYNSMKELASQK
jgi:hypothetical protein